MEESTEDIIQETLDCFDRLPLLELDPSYVRDLWMNSFSSVDEYPSPCESFFCDEVLKQLNRAVNVCEKWRDMGNVSDSLNDDEGLSLDESSSTDLTLWKVLMDNDVDLKSILSFIYIICSKSTKSTSPLYEKCMALKCAKLYFSMLEIPGCSAYSVYHPSLFQLSVSCLKLPKERSSSKKRVTSSSRNDAGGQRKRIHRDICENISDVVENEESEEHIQVDFNPRECEELFSMFYEVLQVLIRVLSSFSIKSDEMLIEAVMQRLIDCTACETCSTDYKFERTLSEICFSRRRHNFSYLVTALAYNALLVLCQSLHGNIERNYLTALRFLSVHILCSRAKMPANQTAISQKYVIIRDNAVSFVCYNLKHHPEYSVRCTKILLQQLCTRVNDKTDFRAKVAAAVIAILKHMPPKAFAEMNEWFVKFVNQTKIQDRIAGLEVLSLFIAEKKNTISSDDVPAKLRPYLTNKPIAKCIIERCSDKASSVRAKALNVLANNLEKIINVIRETEETQPTNDQDSDEEIMSESSFNSESTPIKSRRQPHVTGQNGKKDVEELVAMLHARLRDFKVHARKAALQVIENLVCLDEEYLTEENLNVFLDAIADPNITVRKAAICSATSILQTYCTNTAVQDLWLKCVLPLVLDVEKTVQSKCLEEMENQFLLNINSIGEERHCSWNMLKEVACGKHQNLQRFIRKAFSLWKTESRIRSDLRASLQKEVGTENDSAAWLLLSILTACADIRNTNFIVDHWEKYQANIEEVPRSTLSNILRVIGSTAKHIPETKQKVIQSKLEDQIRNISCPLELIPPSVETLFKVYKAQNLKEGRETHNPHQRRFASETMKSCEKALSSVMLEKSNNDRYSEELICQYLVTLGELSLLYPAAIPSKTFLIIQSMIAAPIDDDDRHSVSSQCSGKSQGKSLSPRIQALAFVTLGKLCLQNEDLAKRCVPVFARELSTSKSCVIKNNIVIILSDLCIRYTLMVDLYIPSISACLKDSSLLVRHQTLAVLAKLLQEDYIKLKDTLLYRMLAMVIDDDKDITAVIDYSLGYLMVKRHPTIFVQHFPEAIFFFNACEGTANQNMHAHIQQDAKLFALKGNKNKEKRMTIYKFMAKNTPVPKRISLMIKLCQEILSAVSSNTLPLNKDTEAVVKDCLAVLSCEEIKLPALHATAAEDGDERDAAEALVVKTAQRVYLVQLVIPIIITFKKMLETLKSPLLTHLMIFLREICKDYKTELKDIFAADKQLGDEIEFEIRKLEREEEKRLERERIDEDDEAEMDIPSTPIPDRTLVERIITVSERLSANNPPMARALNMGKRTILQGAEPATRSRYTRGNLPPENASKTKESVNVEKFSLSKTPVTGDSLRSLRMNGGGSCYLKTPLQGGAETQSTSSRPSSPSKNRKGTGNHPVVLLKKLEAPQVSRMKNAADASTPIGSSKKLDTLLEANISDINASGEQSAQSDSSILID